MIQKLLHVLLAPRHPWRKVGFSELSEIYAAAFLRTVALSMVGIFVPLYLLSNGYRLQDVLLFYALFYSFGICNDYVVAHMIARFGPKHVMRLSFFVQTIFSLMLINLSAIPYAVGFLGFVAAIASTMYFLPYHVDFSKVKHRDHGGKELGFLQVLERAAAVLGPLVGGVLATLFGPAAAFWFSAGAMLVATIILMLTPEPVQTHQKITFKGLNISSEKRDYISFAALSVENAATAWLWPVYLAAVVFAGSAYLKIGGVASFSVFVAVVVAVPLGKLLDTQRGRLMIKYGTAVNACVHISRLFAGSLPGVTAVASVNEPTTLVYRMAYLKGFYDAADDHPGYRITYIAAHEMVGDAARATFWLILTGLSFYLSPYGVCAIGFSIAAICSLMIRVERFAGLR